MFPLRAYVPCHHEPAGWPWFATYEYTIMTPIVLLPTAGMFPTAAPPLPPPATDMFPTSAPAPTQQQERRFRPTEYAILRAATREPMPVKVLARKAQCRLNSHFRATIAALVREGRLVRTADGIALPRAN
jgi:hypothetical protein